MSSTRTFLERQAALTGLPIERIADACRDQSVLARALAVALPAGLAEQLTSEADVVGAILASPLAMSEVARALHCAARVRRSLN